MQIKAKSKCDMTTEALLSMIAQGNYKAGDRLPTEKELTEMFSVSRVTLREAIKRLHSMGIVEIHQGDGTYLRRAGADNIFRPLLSAMVLDDLSIDEIYDARQFVEIGNVRLAVRNHSSEDIVLLKDLLSKMEQALAIPDLGMFSTLDHQFHETIGRLSGNYVLLSTYSALKELLHYYIEKTNLSFETAKLSMFHHQQIVHYIESRNEYLAGITMEQHIEHAKQSLVGTLE